MWICWEGRSFRLVSLVAIFWISVTSACSPSGGNIDTSLALLKQYGGIDWTKGGLDQTGHSPNSFVSQSSELNCDFSDVKQCKWANYPNGTDRLDQMDFELFEKTAPVTWNDGLISPGGTPNLGEKVILTGSRNATPAAAMWYSNPIQCQKNEGTLSFKYWLFSQVAAVEVVALRYGKEPLEIIASPSNDCLFWKRPVGSRCTVKIPPIDQPFHLAVRGHNLYGANGAMAFIGDIKYNADICPPPSNGFDLGPGFSELPLESGANGETLVDPIDMTCDQFDSFCRWTTSPSSPEEWMGAEGEVDPDLWKQATGSNTPPEMPFTIVRPRSGSGRDTYGLLTSDPVPCQKKNGYLSFSWYSTPGVKLEVCTVQVPNHEIIACYPVTRKPGAMIRIPGPIDEEFAVAFRASEFRNPNEDFLALDNIEYDAEFCDSDYPTTETPTTEEDFFYLGDEFEQESLESGQTGRAIRRPTELVCSDFDGSCRWGNGPGNEEGEEWEVGTGEIDPDEWNQMTGSRGGPPETPFAIVRPRRTGGSDHYALLVSDPIPCLRGSGEVSYRFWTSPDVTLEVCIYRLPSFQQLECTPARGSPGPVRSSISGPRNYEFVVGFKASNFRNIDADFAIVDDIRYRGDFCENNQPIQPAEDPDVATCKRLKCGFARGDACVRQYSFPLATRTASRFEIHNKKIGGRARLLTVGSNEDPFLGTVLTRRSQNAVLESPEINLASDKYLKFDFDRAIQKSEFWVCTDEYDSRQKLNRQGACDRVLGGRFTLEEYRNSVNSIVHLLKRGTKKFFIVANHYYHSAGEAPMAIDNVRLAADSSGKELC